jgi:LPXTG-motif cell wall-anchored protein
MNILYFTIGAAIGGIAVWIYIRRKNRAILGCTRKTRKKVYLFKRA